MSVTDHADFLKRLKHDGWEFQTFYDIGASIGSWSYMVRRVFPEARFELFEPLAGRSSEVDDASFVPKLDNCGLHAVALSNENGEAKMKVLGGKGVGSSIVLVPGDQRRPMTFVDVPIRRLDDYVLEAGLALPDFLKLDVQAAELRVLQGAETTIQAAKMILVETWARRGYGPETPLFHELAAYLYERGYLMFDIFIDQNGRDPNGELRWFDAVFINKAHSRHPAYML